MGTRGDPIHLIHTLRIPTSHSSKSLQVNSWVTHWSSSWYTILGSGPSIHLDQEWLITCAHWLLPCTATDGHSSLRTHQCCFVIVPMPFIIVPCPFVIVPQCLIFIFVPLHFLLIPWLFSLVFHTCYRKWYILCILSAYITYNTIADAARSKKVCNTGVSPTFSQWNAFKLTKESQ